MIIIGLTGAVGMGKTAVAHMLRNRGVPVYDADAAIHQLYRDPAIIAVIAAAFPGVETNGIIDRQKLGAIVFGDNAARKKLTDLLYPSLAKLERAFLDGEAAKKTPLVVLEIPLMYETGADQRVDGVMAVRAPFFMQRDRVLARPGMTPARFESILKSQMPSAEKCRRANLCIQTGLSAAFTRGQVTARLAQMQAMLAHAPLKWDTYHRHA